MSDDDLPEHWQRMQPEDWTSYMAWKRLARSGAPPLTADLALAMADAMRGTGAHGVVREHTDDSISMVVQYQGRRAFAYYASQAQAIVRDVTGACAGRTEAIWNPIPLERGALLSYLRQQRAALEAQRQESSTWWRARIAAQADVLDALIEQAAGGAWEPAEE